VRVWVRVEVCACRPPEPRVFGTKRTSQGPHAAACICVCTRGSCSTHPPSRMPTSPRQAPHAGYTSVAGPGLHH
jgi:hypothetical protein